MLPLDLLPRSHSIELALAIRERRLGPDNPDTVSTGRALAEPAAEGGGAADQ